MAKIGTAQIEIKPVINGETLEALTERIARAVSEGVRLGMRAQDRHTANGGVTCCCGDPLRACEMPLPSTDTTQVHLNGPVALTDGRDLVREASRRNRRGRSDR